MTPRRVKNRVKVVESTEQAIDAPTLVKSSGVLSAE